MGLSPCMLAKLHYRLGQNTNATVTEQKTKGQNRGSNSGYDFFATHYSPETGKKVLVNKACSDPKI